MNGFVKGAGYPDSAFAGAPRNTFSWATDLGSGVMNAYSFYLYGSPFFWLSVLLPQSWLPYMMVPLLVLKFGVAGGGAYLYLRRYVKNANYAVLGACLYALSGFAVYNVFFNHFVDVVALFPYLLWALDEAIYENRHGLFAFWVAVNLLNNYFFFVGQVIFLCIYFVCKLTAKDFRLTGRKFGHLLWESVLGVAMGCLLLFPAVLSLLQNPRTIDLSSGWGFLTYAKVQQYLAILLSWILPPDSPYLTSVWSEGVIKWTSMTAYLPLCSLAGAMAYWRSRKADSKKRIVAVCAVCALVPVLNSAFYALNSSYYARWYYMPTLILAAMTVNALEDPDVDLDAPARGIGWIMLATLVFCGSARAGRYHRDMVFRRAEEPGAVLCRAGLWSAGAYAVPRSLQQVAAGQPLCPAHDGGGAGVCLRIHHGAHRHWQVWPVVHRQRPCGAGHQRPAAEKRPAGGRLPHRHLQDPRQHRDVAG